MRPVLRRLLRALADEPYCGLADRQLLERYRSDRDEQAFAALVARHGPLVLGVCRRALLGEQDAEDAFQATFLALARHAARAAEAPTVGGWLYGVARRVALQARRAAARRRRHEREFAAGRPAAGESGRPEALQVLDEELLRLPESLRAPLLLCHLAGRTQLQAAAELGWSLGTLRRRLRQARERLRLRLAARGLVAGALPATPAAGAVPPAVATAAVRAALGGAVSPNVATLTEKGLRTMLLTRTKFGLALALALAVGAGLLAYRTLTAQPPPADPNSAPPNANNRLSGPSLTGGGTGEAPADVDRRLADVEKRLEEALADVKGIRQSLKASKADQSVIRLKHVDAARAAEVLRAAYPDAHGRTTVDAASNSLIIQASPADVQAIRRLLDALDAQKEGVDTKRQGADPFLRTK